MTWVATAGAAVALAVVDPARSTLLPPCPFRALTGMWCPGCGSLRGLHQLLTGDLAAAVGFNPLMVTALPVLVAGLVIWTARRIGWPREPVGLPPAVPWAALGVVLAFSVARNLPVAPFTALAP